MIQINLNREEFDFLARLIKEYINYNTDEAFYVNKYLIEDIIGKMEKSLDHIENSTK